MDIKILEHYKFYFDKQEGRKYPCSNQVVRCAIVTDDRDKAIEFMSDKDVKEKRERKDSIEWFLENGDQWVWQHWNDNRRGYRFYKVAIDKEVDKSLFETVIIPCCSLYCCSMEII